MSDRRLRRSLAHVQRLGIALVCGALGLHPGQLPLDDAVAAARTGTQAAARWARRLARTRRPALLDALEERGGA